MTESIRLDGQLLVAACSAQHDPAARSMLDSFARLHAAGPPLAPGSRIDFGWAPLQIEARGEDWYVCEPDFDSEPLQWLASVNDTLGVLKAQAGLTHQLGVSPLATRGDQTLWLAPDALHAAHVYLHRTEPDSATDSGWYIGRQHEDGDSTEPGHALRMRAGCLLSLKPAWLPVLALPTGCLVTFARDQLAEIHDGRDIRLYPDAGAPDG